MHPQNNEDSGFSSSHQSEKNRLSIHVMTTHINKDRHSSILETWLKSFPDYTFYTDFSTGIGNQVELTTNTQYHSNAEKHVLEINRICNQKLYEKYDWFYFCDDDTAPNIQNILSYIKIANRQKVHGWSQYSWAQDRSLLCLSGGAGYLISSDILSKHKPPRYDTNIIWSDIQFCLWLQSNNIEIQNNPKMKQDVPSIFNIRMDTKEGRNSIREHLSFHYVKDHSLRKQINDIYSSPREESDLPSLEARDYSELPQLEECALRLPDSIRNKSWTNYKQSNNRVPKILHFLWIESIVPPHYLNNVMQFAKMNPSYEVVLWVDKEVPNTPYKPQNLKYGDVRNLNLSLYPKMGRLSTRVDCCRYEIVYRFGGIYCDIDTVSIRPLDDLFTTSFVSYSSTNVQNSFFGFSQGSTYILSLLESIRELSEMADEERGDELHHIHTGGDLMAACLHLCRDKSILCFHEILTGHCSLAITPSEYAYMRHVYHYNWGNHVDPKGKR